MLERGDPSKVTDSSSDVSPYEIPRLIWSLIETYFEGNYGVEVKSQFPSSPVQKPTIVWNIFKRTPGAVGKSRHGTGPSYLTVKEVDQQGFVHMIFVQTQTVYYDYSVFAPDASMAEDIIWDLERAILETVGIIQQKYTGFSMVFDSQQKDSSLIGRQQDDLISRHIRFHCVLPIRYGVVKPAVRHIYLDEKWGRQAQFNKLFLRTSSEPTFTIPVSSGQYVVNIKAVSLRDSNDEWVDLSRGTDYLIKKDANDQCYIEWKDEFGRTPALNEQFRIDYDIAALFRSNYLHK